MFIPGVTRGFLYEPKGKGLSECISFQTQHLIIPYQHWFSFYLVSGSSYIISSDSKLSFPIFCLLFFLSILLKVKSTVESTVFS